MWLIYHEIYAMFTLYIYYLNITMNYLTSKKFALVLAIILLATALNGCGTKSIKTTEPKKPTTLDTIGKLEGIANALGCMFGADCSTLSKANEEEWKELDGEK